MLHEVLEGIGRIVDARQFEFVKYKKQRAQIKVLHYMEGFPARNLA